MAAYAAASSLHRHLLLILNNINAIVSPLTLKTTEFGCMKLKSFKKWVEGLDIRSRKRMNASLGRIAEEICRFEEYRDSDEVSFADDAGSEDFSRRIHSIMEQLKKVEEEYYSFPKEEEEIVSSSSKIVGLCDQRRQLKDDIMVPFNEKPVYSIAGMAGIGKTTLAQEFFDDLDVSEWFDCHVWITVGIEFKPKEIIEFVLAQVDPEAHKMIKGGDEEEISEGLKQCLEGKRYLIVLDDVWNEDVYGYLQRSLPNNKNGSRVLLTTRMNYVAPNFDIYEHINMRLLDKEESWDLLHEKVFGRDSCPPHLHEFGKIIAKKCDGLPLMIVTIAKLLSKAEEPRESLWMDLATKKKHQLFFDAYDQISEVLYPSYNILHDVIKLYFLYLGAFPLKYEIPKSKLVNLWSAEEFFEPSTGTLESCAIEILKLLDLSCIVMVYQRSSTICPNTFIGSVKTCGLHSVWWHFCQIEARKTNCFHVLDCYNKGDLEKGIEGHCRLSIHYNVLFALKDVHNAIVKICAGSALSLLCFGPYSQYMVPVCFGLKSLMRLDALNIRFYDFPLQVLELVMLKYLALTCNEKLPPSVSRLQKLQYLIVHPHLSIKAPGDHSHMPVEIWDLEELKHLEVMGCDLPNFGDTSLLKLLTLSGVTKGSCIILKRIPNLKKLGIRIELAPNVMENLSCFDHISHLTKLESLKCVIVNPECKPEVASFPCLSFSLIKLSLSGMGYPWEEMRKIASLPNLQVFKMRFNAFQGPKWEVEEDEFPNLYSLQIEDIDLLKLKWARGSFKKLGLLRMKHCYKFKELELGNLSNIRKIEVVDCNPWVELHAQLFLLEKDFLQFLVHSSWKS